MVAVWDDQDRDLAGDGPDVVCERLRAEHPVAGRAGGKLSAASRYLHDAVGSGGDKTQGSQRSASWKRRH